MDPETESELEEIQKNLEQHLGKKNLERQLTRTKTATAISDLARVKTEPEAKRKSRLTSVMSEEDGLDVHEETKVGQNLIETEKAEVGGVSLKVYSYYAKSVGYLATFAGIMFLVGFQGFKSGADIWLSKWSDDPLASVKDSVRNKYLSVYGTLGLFQALGVMATIVLALLGLRLFLSELRRRGPLLWPVGVWGFGCRVQGLGVRV